MYVCVRVEGTGPRVVCWRLRFPSVLSKRSGSASPAISPNTIRPNRWLSIRQLSHSFSIFWIKTSYFSRSQTRTSRPYSSFTPLLFPPPPSSPPEVDKLLITHIHIQMKINTGHRKINIWHNAFKEKNLHLLTPVNKEK